MRIRLQFFAVLVIGLFCISVSAQTEMVSPSEKNPKTIELLKQATMLEDAMMFGSAIDKYKEILKLEPKDFAAMNTIAGIYGKTGNFVQEVVWAQKSIDTSPKFWKGYINLGNGLAMQDKVEQAIKAFQKAAEIAPKEPLPIYSLGVVAENRRDFNKALELYSRSTDLDPKFENGLFSAAAMHANLKQFSEAKALLKKLLMINPKDADAQRMLQQIESTNP